MRSLKLALFENIKWVVFVIALLCTVFLTSNISMADELSEAIANQGVVAQMPVAAEVGSGDERDELGSG